jgi:hypothetical protein
MTIRSRVPAPADGAEFDGGLHELACAKICGRSSTADSGGATFARAAAGMPNCLEQTRFPITATATCTIGSGALVGCSSNCTPGTQKSTPISSTPTRRLTDTASSCGSRSTISTRSSSERAGSRRRSSKNRTSTLRPSTGRFGSVTPMATSWLSPVRTAKAAPDPAACALSHSPSKSVSVIARSRATKRSVNALGSRSLRDR